MADTPNADARPCWLEAIRLVAGQRVTAQPMVVCLGSRGVLLELAAEWRKRQRDRWLRVSVRDCGTGERVG